MGNMTIALDDKTENELRKRNRKRGDMSKIITKALDKYFSENKEGSI